MNNKKRMLFSALRLTVWVGVLSWMMCLPLGCEQSCGPKVRLGAFFGSPYGIEFYNSSRLGDHHFGGGSGEYNGMVYTCKAGFIDIAHLREAADRTQYVSELSFRALMQDETEFSFHVIEPAHYFLKIQYPSYWKQLSAEQKKTLAEDVSIHLGQYLAQKTTIWHEIITWFGFATSGVFSEHVSSFSWEDPYSDLTGTILAARALRDKEHTYEEAMTQLIKDQLKLLGAQSQETGLKALQAITDKWFTTHMRVLISMKKRNFDIGIDDGEITPWLVPGICPQTAPLPMPVPTLDSLVEMGFEIQLEIEPKEFETWKVVKGLDLNGSNRILPEKHFPVILEHIKKQAHERYGEQVETPEL